MQIRTIAMDFWASLEHQLQYKTDIEGREAIVAELRECADKISRTDTDMMHIRSRIEKANDIPSEDEILFERLKRFDMPIE